MEERGVSLAGRYLPKAGIVSQASLRVQRNIHQNPGPPMSLRRTAGSAKAVSARQGQLTDSGPSTAVAISSEVEIEINQTVVVSKIDSLVQAWCEGCGAEGQWVTPEHAAIISNTDTRSIYRRIEIGEVHFIEATDGPALVCLSSLFA